ncbi:TPA: transcriptional regulator [Morganella morganii]|nr:transcriptional regulator [Morganella morganii]
MKTIVINNSGNVGKTTICQNLLLPRLPDSEVIRVETLNDDGESTGEKLGADQFDEIFESILSNDNVIVDVGASNVEMFSHKLKNEFVGSHSFIDYFIIPVTPEEKQQRDTIATIIMLLNLGVDDDKIKVVFNRVNPKKDIQSQFSTLINSDKLEFLGYKFDNLNTGINNAGLFESLKKADIDYSIIRDISSEKLEEQIKNEEDKKKKTELNILKFYKMGFDSYQSNLQDVFVALDLQ